MLQNRKKNFFIHEIDDIASSFIKIAIIEFQMINYAKSIKIVINFLFL